MTVAPELLYLLAGDPAEFAEVVREMQPADVADALRALAPPAAARVLAALPFDLAVMVLDDPELENRVEIMRAMDPHTFAPLLGAMSGDRQADLFREMGDEERARFLPVAAPEGAGRPAARAALSARERRRHHDDGVPQRPLDLDGGGGAAAHPAGGRGEGDGVRGLRRGSRQRRAPPRSLPARAGPERPRPAGGGRRHHAEGADRHPDGPTAKTWRG